MSTFHLRILTPHRTFFDGEAVSVAVPLVDGQYGILAFHSNMIGTTIPGKLKIALPDGKEQIAAVSGGLLKTEDNEVLLLVESAEHPEEIDEARARRDIERAREELAHRQNLTDHHAAQAKIARALNRLRIREENR